MPTKAEKKELLQALLRRELQQSETYVQQITAMLKEHFARALNPDIVRPQINKVSITPDGPLDFLCISVDVMVQVTYLKKSPVSYDVTLQAPVDWDNGETEEMIAQQIHSALPHLMEIAMRELQRQLPRGVQEILKGYTPPKLQKLGSILTDLVRQPDVQAVFREKKAAMQASIAKQQAKAPCPPGFQLANITALQLRWKITPKMAEGTLRIDLDGGLYSEKQVRFSLGDCPFYLQETKKREALQKRISRFVVPFVKRLEDIPLLYVATSPREIPGMTEHLESLLQHGTVSLGHVTVNWRRPSYMPNAYLLYLPLERNGKTRLGKSGTDVRSCPEVPLIPSLLDQKPLRLDQYQQLPRDLAGLCRLGETLETFLEEAFQGKEIPAPQVQLRLGKQSRLHINCGSKSTTLEKRDMAAGAKLQMLVEQAIGAELEKPLERQRQLAVLNTLNPTELAVLRCIASVPEARGTAVADAIESRVCTTKAYTGTCIQHLTTLEVQWAGKTMPLLQAKTEINGKLNDTCMFRVSDCIDREMLASVSGRPFHLEETAVLKPAARGDWFTNYLLEADDKQRWTRFNEALDRMPSTFLAAFAKSDEGQAFLKGFTGDDAVFVRLTVEGLPGCKRLAAKLWPDGAESEEEAE